jgi:hypothetical protein
MILGWRLHRVQQPVCSPSWSHRALAADPEARIHPGALAALPSYWWTMLSIGQPDNRKGPE